LDIEGVPCNPFPPDDVALVLTGADLNDSPALRKANVGIARIPAKDVADVVLLDNNFEAIVKGVEEGCLTFSNLRKVIGYLIAAGSWTELIPEYNAIENYSSECKPP
jgi:sodium/potassium-transporting ATPase subunit alpha